MLHDVSFASDLGRHMPAPVRETCTFAEFARRKEVKRATVAEWVRRGRIRPHSISGSGASARIIVEAAEADLARDPAESLTARAGHAWGWREDAEIMEAVNKFRLPISEIAAKLRRPPIEVERRVKVLRKRDADKRAEARLRVRTPPAQAVFTTTTALLMGDPPPHRSALGRPLAPHEEARGEGHYRDHFLRRNFRRDH